MTAWSIPDFVICKGQWICQERRPAPYVFSNQEQKRTENSQAFTICY